MVWLSIFWISVVLAIVFLILTPFLSRGKNVLGCIVLTVLLLIISHFSATFAFGYGKVPPIAEEFSISARLKEGVAYHLIHSERQGDSYVLLMNEFGTHKTLAVRWNIEPPKLFLLVDGEIIAIQK